MARKLKAWNVNDIKVKAWNTVKLIKMSLSPFQALWILYYKKVRVFKLSLLL